MATRNNFAAEVSAWVRKSEARMTAVFRQSTQEVVEDMQLPRGAGGRMRVDTGFLRASLVAAKDRMPPIRMGARPTPGAVYPDTSPAISLFIAGADIGGTLFFGYTASYAGHREYGARGQAPDAFVRGAAQKWKSIVEDVTRRLRNRAGK